MPGDENDRKPKPGGDEFPLKVEAASPRQPHVEHKTGWSGRTAGLEEFIDRGEQHCLQPDRSQKTADRLPDCGIVIDDDNGRCRLGHPRFSP